MTALKSIHLTPMDRCQKAETPIEILAFVAVGLAFAAGTAIGAVLSVLINTVGWL